jgi:hypothetical protein
MKHYYIIKFNDLSDRKQNEIISHLKRLLTEDVKVLVDVKLDEREGAIDTLVESACARTSYGWEVEC